MTHSNRFSHRTRRFAIMVTIVAIALIPATSQLKAQSLRLSLNDAQRYAVEHNKAMINANLDTVTAELNKWKAWASMLPQVRFGFDYQNMCGYSMSMGGFNIPMNPNGTLSLTASVNSRFPL